MQAKKATNVAGNTKLQMQKVKDDSTLLQLFIMLHRPVNFEISAVACTCQQANLKKQWSMKYYKLLNGKAIIFTTKLNTSFESPVVWY